MPCKAGTLCYMREVHAGELQEQHGCCSQRSLLLPPEPGGVVSIAVRQGKQSEAVLQSAVTRCVNNFELHKFKRHA
jgi:hypothetical protein